MYHVDIYRRVRLAAHRDRLSQRELARRFGAKIKIGIFPLDRPVAPLIDLGENRLDEIRYGGGRNQRAPHFSLRAYGTTPR